VAPGEAGAALGDVDRKHARILPGELERSPCTLEAVTAASFDDGEPIGYKALPRGVPVHTSEGIRLGTVHEVKDNAREHIFDGIVVDTPAGRRFVDAPEVARITTMRVTLTIDAREAQDLPVERGVRGSIEERARRAGRRWRRRLSR
jgi:hypothetical protein